MQAAAQTADQLTPVVSLLMQNNPNEITLFTVSGEGQIRSLTVKESEVRTPTHPLYGFFAYTQQLLGAFRAQQEAAAAKTAK